MEPSWITIGPGLRICNPRLGGVIAQLAHWRVEAALGVHLRLKNFRLFGFALGITLVLRRHGDRQSEREPRGQGQGCRSTYAIGKGPHGISVTGIREGGFAPPIPVFETEYNRSMRRRDVLTTPAAAPLIVNV